MQHPPEHDLQLQNADLPKFDSFAKKRVSLIFAHQDHEILVAELIRRLRSIASMMSFAYVSNGDSNIAPEEFSRDPGRRERESTASLGLLGVQPEQIHYLRTSERHLTTSLANPSASTTKLILTLVTNLREHLQRVCPDIIITDAFEGSNPSHDLLNWIVYNVKPSQVPMIEFPHYTLQGPFPSGTRVGTFTNDAGKTHLISDSAVGMFGGELPVREDGVMLKEEMARCHETQYQHIQATFAPYYRRDVEMRREQFREVISRDFRSRPTQFLFGRPVNPLFYEAYAIHRRQYQTPMTFESFCRAINDYERA